MGDKREALALYGLIKQTKKIADSMEIFLSGAKKLVNQYECSSGEY